MSEGLRFRLGGWEAVSADNSVIARAGDAEEVFNSLRKILGTVCLPRRARHARKVSLLIVHCGGSRGRRVEELGHGVVLMY